MADVEILYSFVNINKNKTLKTTIILNASSNKVIFLRFAKKIHLTVILSVSNIVI